MAVRPGKPTSFSVVEHIHDLFLPLHGFAGDPGHLFQHVGEFRRRQDVKWKHHLHGFERRQFGQRFQESVGAGSRYRMLKSDWSFKNRSYSSAFMYSPSTN